MYVCMYIYIYIYSYVCVYMIYSMNISTTTTKICLETKRGLTYDMMCCVAWETFGDQEGHNAQPSRLRSSIYDDDDDDVCSKLLLSQGQNNFRSCCP